MTFREYENLKVGDVIITNSGITRMVISAASDIIVASSINSAHYPIVCEYNYKDAELYQQAVDEEKRDDLATAESGNFTKTDKFSDIVYNITDDLEHCVLEGYYNGFEAGYRKAKEK